LALPRSDSATYEITLKHQHCAEADQGKANALN
jgi:hypothetical protein